MLRRLVSFVAAGAVASTVAVAAPAPATAAPYVPPSAYSSAVGTGTATLSASLSLTGTLGGLLDAMIAPIVTGALNPLLQALGATANSTIAAALGASSSFVAGTPASETSPGPGAFPTELPSGLPSPCLAAGAEPCYNGTNVLSPITSLLLASIASVRVNALSGYTQFVAAASNPEHQMLGRAQLAGVEVGVLPLIPSLVNPLVNIGAADARATCPNNGTPPSADVSAASVSLLGGLITLGVADGAITSLVVNGTSYGTLVSLPVVHLPGITIAPYGTAVKLSISLDATALLGGLGLSSGVVSMLLGNAPTSAVTLSVIVGPNSALTTTTAKAWGLGVGVDLSGSLGFTLLGLVGATVTIPSGIGGGNYGNLLDLRLAYTTCTVGSSQPGVSRAVPPTFV